jgi:hypothetical protein
MPAGYIEGPFGPVPFTVQNTFQIPKGYTCYCHPCDMPFKSIEEMQKHNNTTTHYKNKEIYLQVKQ